MTAVPFGVISTTEAPLTPLTASPNLAVTFAPRATPTAPGAGVLAVMVGRGPVVKLHLVDAKASRAPSLIALLSVTVYVASAASVRLGFSVATREVLL